MLVGEPPYTGPSAAAIIARRLSEPLPSLRVVRDAVPPAVERAIHKALARSPADRFRRVDQFAHALTAPAGPAGARWAITNRTLFIVGAAVLIVTSAFLLPGAIRRLRATVVPAANVIAVLPLVPASADSALERLGQNLVITLSTNLDGLGGMRAIDPLTVLAQAQHKPSAYSTLGGALEIGRGLGASGVIRGALTRDGSRVRIYLALYATADSAIVGQASVLGSPDSIAGVTDAATWALLQQIWRARDPPTPSLAAITTHSIPALRAFLDGERALSLDRWSDAGKAYARAIGEDSTFALALWRYAYARWWIGEETDSVSFSAAVAHLSELPEKDRALAEVWAARRENVTPETLHRARALTERVPDYWPAWFEYADQLFHSGPMLGYDLRLASQAFERVLELNPRLIPAWNHLLDAQIVLQDTAIVARCLTKLDSLDPLDANAPPRESRHLRRWQIPLLRGARFEGSAADSLVADIASVQSVYDQTWLVVQFNAIAGPAAQIELSRRVLSRTPWRAVHAIHRKGIALSWAARGSWNSAMAAIDDYASRASDLAGLTPAQIGAARAGPDLAKLDPYRLAVVGAWLGAIDPGLALARREVASQAVTRIASPWRQAELFWLDGLLAFSQHNLAGLRQAQRRLTEVDTAAARPPLQSLAAFELELLGRQREAADSMAAMAWRPGWFGPYWGVNRLVAARWLAREGDLDQAARLLPWWQAMNDSPDFVHGVIVLWAPSLVETARVEAARGNKVLARENYQQFLWLYDSASPTLRGLVDDARAALARLGAEPTETRGP
jgi:tetratricopeptide (TPR) repeat protein/TolB-like protein